MKILFLLLPTLLLAQAKQYCFTAAELDYNWNLTQGYKHDAEKWKLQSDRAQVRLDNLASELAGVSDSLLEAINERDELHRQNTADQLELEKLRRVKRFGIGAFAGYGASVRSDQLYLSPMIGVGVTFNLIRF